MTHSRAYLLIQREYEKLTKDPPWGIHVRLASEGNPFRWIVSLSGPRESAWERGSFVLIVEFSEFYHQHPPFLRFHTIPFHPNIDAISGEPCLRHVTEQCNWNPNYSLTSVLVAVQSLLAEPHPEEAVNPDASRILLENASQYQKVVRQCVERSRLVHYDDIPLIEDIGAIGDIGLLGDQRRSGDGKKRREATTAPKAVMGVSFEDYYHSWKGLATSATPLWPSAGSPDTIRSRSISSQSTSSVKKTTEKPKKAPLPSTKDNKIAAMEKMKNVYLQRDITENSVSSEKTKSEKTATTGTEKWRLSDGESYTEAEDLDDKIVEWTQTLDETQIDQW